MVLWAGRAVLALMCACALVAVGHLLSVEMSWQNVAFGSVASLLGQFYAGMTRA